jgi:DNA polymerase-4
MDRTILHSDINSCYASIEHAEHPELDGLPLAVGGNEKDRHGIILAKDEAARRCGVRTGMAIWQAKALCPELNILPPRMGLYMQVAGHVKEIYADYTDQRESFGIDESWLDISGCGDPSGLLTANEIRRRVRRELGITVSVGISWNKSFAKLGSDYKKPDAVTSISRDNFRGIVWPLPVDSLLYVGRATSKKLHSAGICTVGELARTAPELLRAKLGRAGYSLHACANGLDASPVLSEEMLGPVKSVSNSTTLPRDLVSDGEVLTVLASLADSVGLRLRRAGLLGRCVTVSVRGADLSWQSRQSSLRSPTDATAELISTGMALFRHLHIWPAPVRSLGLGISDLTEPIPEQLDLFGASERRERLERLDSGLDNIRKKYGYSSICRGSALLSGAALPGAGERPLPAFVSRAV